MQAASGDGAALYATHCTACHGTAGRGDGVAARYLFPKPRDFTRAKYKIRSTAMGDVPTDEDLLGTLDRGIPGTAMPSFGHLPAADRAALVKHLKALAVIDDGGKQVNLFERFGAPRIITVAKELPATPELVKKGETLYKVQGCAKCHGEGGIGDGPSASTLVDDGGFPIPPANFTRGLYKGGPTA
jgi:cytochrome c oxidase cbb3-type subunit 2